MITCLCPCRLLMGICVNIIDILMLCFEIFWECLGGFIDKWVITDYNNGKKSRLFSPVVHCFSFFVVEPPNSMAIRRQNQGTLRRGR